MKKSGHREDGLWDHRRHGLGERKSEAGVLLQCWGLPSGLGLGTQRECRRSTYSIPGLLNVLFKMCHYREILLELCFV